MSLPDHYVFKTEPRYDDELGRVAPPLDAGFIRSPWLRGHIRRLGLDIRVRLATAERLGLHYFGDDGDISEMKPLVEVCKLVQRTHLAVLFGQAATTTSGAPKLRGEKPRTYQNQLSFKCSYLKQLKFQKF